MTPRRRSGDDIDRQERRDELRGLDPNDPNRYGTLASTPSMKRKHRQEKRAEEKAADEESKAPPTVIDSDADREVPTVEYDEISPLDVTLEDWFNKKKRSYDGYYDVEWGVPKSYFVKKQTSSSWVKLTEWNT